MARPKSLKPAYCLHKPSGRAFVKIDGRQISLGTHGSQESRDAYDRVIGEWIARGRQCQLPIETDVSPSDTVSVAEVISAFWTHANSYYRNRDGSPADELENFRLALKPLNRLYGTTPALKFGPLALKAVRAEMIQASSRTDPRTNQTKILPGWSRTYANRQIGRLKHVFKWATEQELIPPSIHQALAAISGLRKGRCDARETDPVKPVLQEIVDATLPHLSAQVQAMIKLQLLTGMRPGEVCAMRGIDLETEDTAPVWTYRPAEHKTEHHGHDREIHLGPKARAVLATFLKSDLNAFIFSPADAEAARRDALNKSRKTPAHLGNRPGTNRTKNPKRTPRSWYSVAAYRRAIARACEKAFKMPTDLSPAARTKWRCVNVWHPHQLRHTAGTLLRKEFGLEAARVILGHRSPAITSVYAEIDTTKAKDVMRQIG